MTNFKYLMLFLLIMSLNTLSAQEVEADESIEQIFVNGSYLKTIQLLKSLLNLQKMKE